MIYFFDVNYNNITIHMSIFLLYMYNICFLEINIFLPHHDVNG